MTRKRVDLNTCVWGEWHLDVMRRVMLPTLLSPGNLPTLSRRVATRYRIATTPADRERIEAWPIFTHLAATVEIEWITENTAPDITYHIEWYKRALRNAKTANAYCFMAYPDVAWSDGILARCADAIAAGKVGVAIPYIRVISETFGPDLASRAADAAITLSGGELVRLGVRHMHPLSVAAMAGGRHALPSLEVLWLVPGQGLLLRQMSRELSLIDTERLQANQYCNAVNSADPESLHVAADSDDMLMLSLAPLFKDFHVYIPHHAVQPIDLARVSLHPANDNPFVKRFAAHQIRLHYDGFDANRWRRFERRADRFVSEALFMREFLRVWNAAQANGCSLASQAMSIGLVATSLASRWRHDGPVTAYIPTDDAFGNRGWDTLAVVVAPERADDLERMILNHVVEGVTSNSASGSWQQVALSGAPLHYRIDRGGEFVNGARITRRLDVPPHRICIVDRLLASADAAPGPAAGVPRDATQTETKDREFGAGHARAAARSRKRIPFVLLFRRNFANGMRNVRATARAATAKIRTCRSYFAATLSRRGAAQFISDEDIAQHYTSFLQNFGVELDDEDLQRQKRAAAAALYQAGLYRHKLLFLYELMKGFSTAAGPVDPDPVFFNYCSSLIGGEEDLARAALYYRLALQLVPDFAEALYALGLLKRRAGATTEAIALFEAAADAQPHPNAVPHAHIAANSWRNLAEIRLEYRKNELAEACFRKALDHLGIHGVYHAQIAEFMRARGHLAAAARQFELLMPYSHVYASQFSEPNYPPEDRLPLDLDGRPCDPLKPTDIRKSADGGRLVYWWHLYLPIPPGTPFDAASLVKMRPQAQPIAETCAV